MPVKKQLRVADNAPPGTRLPPWVQTDRSHHVEWSRLGIRFPKAAALLHILVAAMGKQNTVVISQKTIATTAGCSIDTVQRAMDIEAKTHPRFGSPST